MGCITDPRGLLGKSPNLDINIVPPVVDMDAYVASLPVAEAAKVECSFGEAV